MKLKVPLQDPTEDRLLDFVALGYRWGCHPRIAWRRVRELGIPIIKFNKRAYSVRLSDILKAELALEGSNK
jgi:hypothetical protein